MVVDEVLDFLVALIEEIRLWNRQRSGIAVRLVITAGPPMTRTKIPFTSVSGQSTMATTLTIDQQLPMTVHGEDAKGVVVPTLGSVPLWTVPATSGVLTVAPDGLSSTFVPIQAGDAVISVSALAAAGDATPLTASVTLTVTPAVVGKAVKLVIVTGDPVPKVA